MICHLHNIWSWQRALAPIFVHITSKKGPYILYMLHKNFNGWKQFKFFILSGNLLLRESPFHIINCLKLFDFTLFFAYTLKLVKGSLRRMFLLYFEKHMTWSRACGSRVFHQLSNKTIQKLSAQDSERGARDTAEKRGSRDDRLVHLPLISTTVLDNIQRKELASFYSTIELNKVLYNVIKTFFDHSVMLRIT